MFRRVGNAISNVAGRISNRLRGGALPLVAHLRQEVRLLNTYGIKENRRVRFCY